MECNFGTVDGSLEPARVWALVVHHDFINTADPRLCNKIDVKMLKDEFSRRHCEYKEMASKCKDDILLTLGSEDELFKRFEADANSQAPDVLFVFILSHGGRDGKIYTDHLLPNSSDSTGGEPPFEHYYSKDVWNGLRKMPRLSNCLKVLIFGPCRGTNLELRLPANEALLEKNAVDPKSVLITSEPNNEDFVVFYPTVETNYSNTNNEQGSWLISALCCELRTMCDDTDLIIFLNRVQHRICANSIIDNNGIGQTPQIQYFKHKKLTIYSCPVVESTDAIISNSDLSELLTVKTKDFYTWKSDKGVRLRRGRALIFSDKSHTVLAEEFEQSFKELDFETVKYNVLQLAEKIKEVTTVVDCGLIEDGCIAICVLSKLVEEDGIGLSIRVPNAKNVSINLITRSLIGTTSNDLAGKPKLVFFIDQGGGVDGIHTGQCADDFAVHGNNHAEIFVVLGVASSDDSERNFAHAMARELRNPQLKEDLSLQEAVANTIRRCSVGTRVLPQVWSTMSKLINFQPCLTTYYKPKFISEDCPEPISFDNLAERIMEQQAKSWMTCTWLLSSSAGLGKSSATKEMAWQLRKKLQDFLIVSISLVKTIQFLHKEDASKSNYVRLLSHVLIDVQEEQIKEKIEQKKIFVLMDGFDEIDQSHEDLVIKYLLEMNAANVPLWITTRVHRAFKIRSAIKKERCDFIELVPMEEKEQTDLLMTFLYKTREDCEMILKKFSNEFAATPLHLKMIAEIADDIDNVEGSLSSLYYHFVINKVKSAMFKFSGTTERAPNFARDLKENLELLAKVAMNYFFLNNLPSKKLRIKKKNRINELGIATATFEVENDKEQIKSIIFVHQTFAEFLLSLLFLTKSGHSIIRGTASNDFLDEVKNIDLSELLLKSQFDQVRTFVDSYFQGKARDEKVKNTELENACSPSALQSKKVDLMAYICKEGHARLFQVLFEARFKTHFGDVTKLINTPFEYHHRDETYSYYPLYAACLTNEDLALHLLAEGARLDLLKPSECKTEEKRNILHLTASNGMSRVTKRILNELPDLANEEDEHRNTPLDLSAKEGKLECLKVFIESCNNDDMKIYLRKRALRFAADGGHREMVRYLMGENLDILKDNKGCPPLYSAVSMRHLELAEELIDITNDVNVQVDKFADTAVHAACSNNDIRMLTMLHKKGAKLESIVNDLGSSPLHTAMQLRGTMECFEYLLKQGVNVNPKNNANETPYIQAARYGRLDCLKLLESYKADIFAKSLPFRPYGRMTALDRATLHSRPDCVAHLLDHEYPVETKRHAFFIGLAYGDHGEPFLKVLEVFIERGFSPDYNLFEGKTPIVVLAERCQERWDKLQELNPVKPPKPNIKSTDDNSEFSRDAPFYHEPKGIFQRPQEMNQQNLFISGIAYLIKKGASVNHVPSPGGSAMHIAAGNGDLILMEFLLENKANPNVKDRFTQQTPLHFAARNGKIKAVEFLLAIGGVDIDATDFIGNTPLMLAAEGNHTQVVQFLLDKDADLSSTRNGLTATFLAANSKSGGISVQIILDKVLENERLYHLNEALCGAVDAGNVDLVMSLFEKGAVLTSTCFRSPLWWAIDNNNEEMVRLIINLISPDEQKRVASEALVLAVQKDAHKITCLLVEEFGAVGDKDGISTTM